MANDTINKIMIPELIRNAFGQDVQQLEQNRVQSLKARNIAKFMQIKVM